MDVMFIILLGVLGLILLTMILGSFFTVETAQVAVITRFGKFLRVADPGLNWKFPYIDTVAGVVSLRVNQISLTMETKTKDNVFVTIPISVQNRVRPEKVFDAYYKLSDPTAQIKSYVEQVILGHVPGMTLDEVFASQSSIAAAVKQELDADMATFGFEIVNVLVTDIVPDQKVKSAMNDINAAQREQVAANARGEAEKILVVKKAEAESESKALQGQGIANQRKAIIEGLQSSTVAGSNWVFPANVTVALNAPLGQVSGVTVDSHGNVYLADLGNARIFAVSPTGGIRIVAGNGTPGFSGDGGPATAASLSSPYGMAVDALGNLFIADWGNARIRKVTPSGVITTVAGGGTADPSRLRMSPTSRPVPTSKTQRVAWLPAFCMPQEHFAGIANSQPGNTTPGAHRFWDDGGARACVRAREPAFRWRD